MASGAGGKRPELAHRRTQLNVRVAVATPPGVDTTPLVVVDRHPGQRPRCELAPLLELVVRTSLGPEREWRPLLGRPAAASGTMAGQLNGDRRCSFSEECQISSTHFRSESDMTFA
jgi:hypothetical protein